MPKSANRSSTVLLLADRRTSVLKRQLTKAGYRVVESYTTDRAVAMCVNNDIDAAILDQECFVETDGWSVAQSLKAVKPSLCVLLLNTAEMLNQAIPHGVDAMLDSRDSQAVLKELGRLLRQSVRGRTA